MGHVIHASSDANFTGFTYSRVYASVAATPVINGTSIPMIAGGTIDIDVNSISSTANVFLFGGGRVIAPKVING